MSLQVTAVDKNLDVLEKYEALVKQSLGSESVYIRMKETVESLGHLKDTDKAKIISDVLSSINGSIVSSAMSTALQWASSEKDIELKKLELSKQVDILSQQNLLTEQQVANAYYEGIATQAQTRRMFGVPVVVAGVVTGLSEEGKVLQDTNLVIKQVSNAEEENKLLKSKLNESHATIHKVIADTYTNFGTYTWASLGTTGVAGVTKNSSNTTLSAIQAEIAKGQANGYAYNAWANAVTGASSMLGTAVAAGADEFINEGEQTAMINTIKTGLDNLIIAPKAYS